MARAKSDLLLGFALTLLTNLLYFAPRAAAFFYPDSATSLTPARFLLHGAGFVHAPGVVETMRTPGYPIVLLPFLLLQHTAAAVVIAQHLLNALLAMAIYLLARRRLDRATALV